MKTLRISDDAHLKLTALLGELTAQTMRMQTYTDAIENLLSQSVSVPPELLAQIERFVEKNKHLGFPTKDEFIRDAIRWRLHILGDEYECLEIQREDYEKAQRAIKDMELPFWNVAEFVERQIKGLIEKYDEWLKQKEAYEQTRRKSR
ncbi:MAG: ribbon-helix-helix domain-containing protein [Candidatus Bathyarchaeia archaeon]